MVRWVSFVMHLPLFGLSLLSACLATEPIGKGNVPPSGSHLDDVPQLVSAATGKLAAELITLLHEDDKEASRYSSLRRAKVPGAAVHIDLGQALGRLQQNLKEVGAGMSEWTKTDEQRMSISGATAGAEYRRQQDKVLHQRHMLDQYLNASNQRQVAFSAKFTALEANEKSLEADLQQIEHPERQQSEKSKKLVEGVSSMRQPSVPVTVKGPHLQGDQLKKVPSEGKVQASQMHIHPQSERVRLKSVQAQDSSSKLNSLGPVTVKGSHTQANTSQIEDNTTQIHVHPQSGRKGLQPVNVAVASAPAPKPRGATPITVRGSHMQANTSQIKDNTKQIHVHPQSGRKGLQPVKVGVAAAPASKARGATPITAKGSHIEAGQAVKASAPSSQEDRQPDPPPLLDDLKVLEDLTSHYTKVVQGVSTEALPAMQSAPAKPLRYTAVSKPPSEGDHSRQDIEADLRNFLAESSPLDHPRVPAKKKEKLDDTPAPATDGGYMVTGTHAAMSKNLRAYLAGR